ncbi:hypothetical protein BM526_16150 [Alteromonas mediterranea]|uniref:Glycosyl transferase family 1 domain-containing protein n=1 Tax=Alteromonas mediterranea TaxID=314275 RepID=A0AAC9NSY1_9ALTE|nr:hypothetical protein [Alteromonas mediterranea]APD91159.1 hypothetical protein BM524_15905 [Alteromonas mediterranea]APE03251.1 hypothetical protein BM526_16150 [Alteromonas mediterranea]
MRLLNLSSKHNILKIPFLKSSQIEVNTLNLFVILMLFICGKLKFCHILDHNASRHYHGFKKRLLIKMLSHAKKISVVNENLTRFYPTSFNPSVISPFLPPDTREEQELLRKYPFGLLEFVDSPNVLMNSAWKYIPFGDGDLYGIEESIVLLEKFSDVKLLLCVGVGLDEVPRSLMQRIKQYTQENRLFLLSGQYHIWPLLKNFDLICLRLTPTDGDSVTVREALFYGRRVIASDSVARPPSCKIYKYKDSHSLHLEIEKLL